ncbi:MAG: hypothetical protein ACTHK2_09155 [Dokdonella sp.]|uniref:hypothetical protein n=1 Tax=Dokdonella sp. TaxID=2291710 RepID=UPI003F7D0A02
MTYRDVNTEKYAFLLARGTHSGELKRFFTESQKQLILKQAKVQNLPSGRDNRIKVLSERLPRSTDGIVQTWFSANLNMTDLLPVEEVLSDLALYEEMGESIPEDREKILARSALVHLFVEAPSAELIEFLRRRPGEQSLRPNFVAEAATSSLQAPAADTVADDRKSGSARNDQIAALVSALLMGDELAIDEALAPLPQPLQTFVNALTSAKGGDIEQATALEETFDVQSKEAGLIHRAVALARHKPGKVDAVAAGLRINVPQQLEQIEPQVLDVVGIYSAQTEKVVFLKPIGLVVNERVFRLTFEDRARLFPESGDVMSYREAGRHLPRPGELARWIVEERDAPGGKTRFHYVREPSHIVEVFNVPFPSSTPDEVRAHIKQLSSQKPTTSPHRLFALADGVVVAPPRNIDPKRDESYEQPWQSWGSLDAWLFEGRQYALGVPQLPSSHLDLSPLEAAFKKLIKNIGEEQKLLFTKNQLRELGQLIRARDGGDVALRAKRVAEAIDRIRFDVEAVDELLPILIKRDEIEARVEKIVGARVEERLKEKASIVSEIEAAKGRHSELQRESKDLERRINKQRSEIQATVRDTFAKAIQDGVASLAQAEVIKHLTSPGFSAQPVPPALPAMAREASEPTHLSDINVSVIEEALSRSQGVAQLVKLGLGRRRSEVLVEALSVLGRSGVCLVLRGVDARQHAKVLGRIDSDTCAVVEVPMGLTSAFPVAKAIKCAPGLKSLVIHNADLSPLDVYAAPVFDQLIEMSLSEEMVSLRVVLSCSAGDMALPIPPFVKRCGVFVDVDQHWDERDRSLEELDEKDIPLMKAMIGKISRELEALEPTIRRSLESLIVRSFAQGAG